MFSGHCSINANYAILFITKQQWFIVCIMFNFIIYFVSSNPFYC